MPLKCPTLCLLLAGAGLLGACSNQATSSTNDWQPDYEPLVELADWHGLSRGADPFATASPVAVPCLGPGFRVEEAQSWLEIDTGLCNWVTLSARARSGVKVGQMLRLRVSHYDLDAPAPTQAQLKLTFAGCSSWEKTIPIPGRAAVYTEQLASPCALATNGEVLFHLHNHGQNTYQLQELAVLR